MSETNIANDYGGFHSGIYYPPEFWNRNVPIGKYDLVKIKEDDLLHSSQPLMHKPADTWRYIDTPALPYFTLHLTEAGDEYDSEFKFDYVPLPSPLEDETNSDGVVCSLKIACRMAFRWVKHLEWSPVFGMIFGVVTDPKDNCSSPSIKFEWMCEGNSEGFDLEEFAEKQLRHAQNYYMRIQALLLNRPEVFRECKEMRDPNVNRPKHKKGKHGQRKVKTYRVLTVDNEKMAELTAVVDGDKREFTCPCWGVMGHIRRYKSGKEVWIHAHTKGKERNNPGSYCSKQYEIVREAATV